MVVGGRILGRLAGALALSLAIATASAQTPAPSIVAAGLIERANAQGVFEAMETGGVRARHQRSGLVCTFSADGAGGRIVVFPTLARGEDVGCDTTDGRESVTLYATRYPRPTTLEEQIAGAEEALRNRFPDAQPYDAAEAAASDSAPAPYRSIEFIVSRPSDGARMYTRAAVTIISGWTIKLRYTLIAPDEATAREGERTSLRVWRAALADVMANPIP